MKPLTKAWTQADDDTLREMSAAKKSAALIAARLGRAAASVRGRAFKLGIKLETISEARKRMGLTRADATQTR